MKSKHPQPKKWEQIEGQNSIVVRLQKMIATGRWPTIILATGTSGAGKTATLRLAIRATRCENRPAGSPHPCGHCNACVSDPCESDPMNNVIWVKPASVEGDEKVTYEQTIKNALSAAARGPYLTDPDRPDRDILFVVFDEAHLMPDALRQRALAFTDVENPLHPNVVLVFITMQPEKIPGTPFKATATRGSWLQFATPTDEQVARFLSRIYPDLHPKSVQLIAKASEGSYRAALTKYEDCALYDGYLSPQAVAEVLRAATSEARLKLWKLLSQPSWLPVKNYVQVLCQDVDPSVLMKGLAEDLINHGEYANRQDLLYATECMLSYSTQPGLLSALQVLMLLQGRKLVNLEEALWI